MLHCYITLTMHWIYSRNTLHLYLLYVTLHLLYALCLHLLDITYMHLQYVTFTLTMYIMLTLAVHYIDTCCTLHFQLEEELDNADTERWQLAGGMFLTLCQKDITLTFYDDDSQKDAGSVAWHQTNVNCTGCLKDWLSWRYFCGLDFCFSQLGDVFILSELLRFSWRVFELRFKCPWPKCFM